MVKNDLGKDAVILNIKKIEPKGLIKYVKKSSVEVLAAIDEPTQSTNKNSPTYKEDLVAIEKKLQKLESIMSDQQKTDDIAPKSLQQDLTLPYKNEVIELVYHHLIDNDITEEIALMLIKGINSSDINEVISTVYKRVIKLLDQPKPIEHTDKQKIAIFVGTTGVGKTTTVAKIAADLLINNNKSVGLITTDTYRIAAVDQLKTYAKILNIPIDVAYSATDLKNSVARFADKDIILIDTAGSSQKNEDQFKDTMRMIDELRDSDVYLVLSLVTKYWDMSEIVEKYSCFRGINLIFSKLDETNSIGNIINIKSKYSAKVSYVTTGQNVPDDIKMIDPQSIAKKLLGGEFN